MRVYGSALATSKTKLLSELLFRKFIWVWRCLNLVWVFLNIGLFQSFSKFISFNVSASFYIKQQQRVCIGVCKSKAGEMNSDPLSYFLVHNEPIRTGYIGAVTIRPALTFTNQPINALPREIDSKQEAEPKPGNQEKKRDSVKAFRACYGVSVRRTRTFFLPSLPVKPVTLDREHTSTATGRVSCRTLSRILLLE